MISVASTSTGAWWPCWMASVARAMPAVIG